MTVLYLCHRIMDDIIQHRKLMLNFNDVEAMIGLNVSIKSLFEVITIYLVLKDINRQIDVSKHWTYKRSLLRNCAYMPIYIKKKHSCVFSVTIRINI